MRFATLALLVGLLAQPPIALPPRDAPPAPAEPDAVIRGRVVRADTGAPVRRATVSVHSWQMRAQHSVLTDDQGRWEVKVAAGEYVASANKAGLIDLSMPGPTRPGPPRRLDVRPGQTLDRVEISMIAASAIEGRVIDEAGEPLAFVMVSAAVVVKLPDGTSRANPGGMQSMSDDRGEFRIFGVEPGTYLVAAEGRGPQSPRGPDGKSLVKTFHPGTTNEAEAVPVELQRGREASGLVIVMREQRVSRVAGTVVRSDGEEFRGNISLRSVKGMASYGFGMPTMGNSRFAFDTVAPGDYFLDAFQHGDDGPPERGSLPVVVGESDIDDVVVVTVPDAEVRGEVVFDLEPQQAPRLRDARVRAWPSEPMGMGAIGGPSDLGRLDEAGRFRLWAPRTRVRLHLDGLPDGWFMKAMLHHGADVTKDGLEVTGDRIDSVRLVLTRATSEVIGTLTDSLGRPVERGAVVIFPEDLLDIGDAARERRFGTSGPTDGREFRVRYLRPGRYLAIAVREMPRGGWRPEGLTLYRPKAVAFELGDGEKKVVNLTVVEDE